MVVEKRWHILCIACLMIPLTELRGTWLQELLGKLLIRSTMGSVIQKDGILILLHPVLHLVVNGTLSFYIRAGDADNSHIIPLFTGYHHKFKEWTRNNRRKAAFLGGLNGALYAAMVGFYWRRNPTTATSGWIASALSKLWCYALVPAAACGNGYLSPLIGYVAFGSKDAWGENTDARLFTRGMFGTASALAFLQYGRRAPCAWVTGAVALGTFVRSEEREGSRATIKKRINR